MVNRTITMRYARALFTIVFEGGIVDRIENQLEILDSTLKENEELMDMLQHPRVSAENKKALLDKTVASQADPALRSFLHLLIEKKREDVLPFLLEDYKTVADSARGIVKARVQSVYRLPQPKLESVKAELEKIFNATVMIENELNPELIGGIAVFVGNRVIDASIKQRLKVLRERLLEAQVG